MLPLLKMIRRGLLVQTGPIDQRLSLLHVDDLVGAMLNWLTATTRCTHKTYAIDDGKSGGYSWAEIAKATANRDCRTLKVPRALLDVIANVNQMTSGLFAYSPMLTPGKVRELVHPKWLCNNAEFANDTHWQPGLKLEQGVQQLFREMEK